MHCNHKKKLKAETDKSEEAPVHYFRKHVLYTAIHSSAFVHVPVPREPYACKCFLQSFH